MGQRFPFSVWGLASPEGRSADRGTLGPRRVWARVLVRLLFLFPACLTGCGRPHVATGDELARFNAAGPSPDAVHPDQLPKGIELGGPYRVVPGDVLELRLKAGAEPPQSAEPTGSVQGKSSAPGGPIPAKVRPSQYRVAAGDVIEFQMPAVLRGIGEEVGEKVTSYACRVTETGSIWLPVVGEIAVAGKPIVDIEAAVVAAYFPKLVKNRPSVIARVTERETALTQVVGATGPSGGRDPLAEAFLCRVTDAGAIRLPVVGQIPVAGKALAEIEDAVAAAYCPRYVTSLPTVTARVAEYRMATVLVVGGVAAPGRYELRSDEMSLAGLLMKAGGIGLSRTMTGSATSGARRIRIRHAGQPHDAKPLEVPVRDRNVPVASVALRDGDTVEVESFDDPLFTVTGLVMSPGVHPYSPSATYTLLQALAMCGGIDEAAGPRYATVYRQNGDGKRIVAEFGIGGKTMIGACDVIIKPGDVICLHPNFRTRWNKFWATILHFGAGVYATYPIAPGANSSPAP